MKNELTEQVIISFQKRFAMEKEEAIRQGIEGDERKADVTRIGKKVMVTPKLNTEYNPDFVINDVDVFEDNLRRYLDVIRETDIRSTQMDDRHNERYFLFNIWKNATASDFQNPEKFIARYTNFIQDDTFNQFDNLTTLGMYENSMLMVKREQDDYGFETPYIMHLSLTNGKYIFNLPWIRYGISQNRNGDKIAFIYALQQMEPSLSEKYNEEIKKNINKVNTGVKNYRNVTPAAIAALTVFMGMLEAEGITAIKAPDFLIGRYGRFSNVTTEEETDRIQYNLTNKFLRNFLRLDEQLDNVTVEPIAVDGYNSFLCVSLDKMQDCKNQAIRQLYNLGRSGEKSMKITEKAPERLPKEKSLPENR